MLDDSYTERSESAARLEAVWRDAQVNRREFMAAQLTPLMRGLVLTGTVASVMFLAGMEWLGGNSLPLWPKLLVCLALFLVSLAIMSPSASRHATLAGWLCIALLQLGMLLSGLYRPDSAGWLLPGFLVVIIASSPTWLNTRDFLVAMLLSMIGPAVSWWLLQPGATLVVQSILFMVIALGAATVIHVFIQWQLNAQLRLQRRLAHIASTDMLTGIANRMHFFTLANQRVAGARENGLPLCALYIDVDRFKNINDQFGHATGDEALQAVAATLKSRLREGDVLGRVGGEEFAMLLPATGLDHAAQVGERLRHAIERLDLSCGTLTISVGVAMLRRDDKTVNGLLAAADHALRRAKDLGRNRVEVARSADPSPERGLHLVGDGGSES